MVEAVQVRQTGSATAFSGNACAVEDGGRDDTTTTTDEASCFFFSPKPWNFREAGQPGYYVQAKHSPA